MYQVTLQMNTLEGQSVTRTIDISNIQYPEGQCNVTASDPETQHAMLVAWIQERGNPQHETALALVSWYIH